VSEAAAIKVTNAEIELLIAVVLLTISVFVVSSKAKAVVTSV
jgi:hypothetical protein